MPYIRDRFGHRIKVPEWPSTEGMAILRRHYKKHHPKAFREMIEKGARTQARENPLDVVYEEGNIIVYKMDDGYQWFVSKSEPGLKGVVGETGLASSLSEAKLEARGATTRSNPGHIHFDQALGPKLHEWHDGTDCIYQVGSLIHTGKPVPVEDAEEARDELYELSKQVHNRQLKQELIALVNELDLGIEEEID